MKTDYILYRLSKMSFSTLGHCDLAQVSEFRQGNNIFTTFYNNGFHCAEANFHQFDINLFQFHCYIRNNNFSAKNEEITGNLR